MSKMAPSAPFQSGWKLLGEAEGGSGKWSACSVTHQHELGHGRDVNELSGPTDQRCQHWRCQVRRHRLQNSAVRLERAIVGFVRRPGVPGGIGWFGGSMMVDLLEKSHATFLMEACRRHRDVKTPAGSAEGRGSRSTIAPYPPAPRYERGRTEI